MRRDYAQFQASETEILCIGPDEREAFEAHWAKHRYPFVGLPDPEHTVAKLYGQQVKMLRFGRMPAIVILDKSGIIRYSHYADSMSDIPENEKLLAVLARINRERSTVA